MIQELIDKQDNFEIIRDQIAAILKTESVSQMEKAESAAKDPNLWKLRIYTERSNPWEQFTGEVADTSPLVNVWFDNETFDERASNTHQRQKTEGIFNIDCYGMGISSDEPGAGHKPGDKEAALEVQRAIRLVRNILMSSTYTYLGLRGTVWQRWPQAISVFQPQENERPVEHVVGSRIALKTVSLNSW